MAKPQVTLTFAGDESKLVKSFDNVGQSSKEMSDDIGKASMEVRNSGKSFDNLSDSADNVDTRAMGFRDTITGLQDSFKGLTDDSLSLGDRLFTLGAGVGDLASGMVNFIIPAVKNMTLGFLKQSVATVKSTISLGVNKVAMIGSTVAIKGLTIAQRALNIAMRANPIGIVITALLLLGTGFVLAWKKSETFRKIVTGAGKAVLAVFKGIGRGISAPFIAGFNLIRSAWNNTIGGKGFSIPNWVPGIGGNSFRIPRFHQGGRVPGTPGTQSLAILQAGELVVPASAAASNEVILRLNVPGDNVMAKLIRELFRTGAIRATAGNVRVVVS